MTKEKKKAKENPRVIKIIRSFAKRIFSGIMKKMERLG